MNYSRKVDMCTIEKQIIHGTYEKGHTTVNSNEINKSSRVLFVSKKSIIKCIIDLHECDRLNR